MNVQELKELHQKLAAEQSAYNTDVRLNKKTSGENDEALNKVLEKVKDEGFNHGALQGEDATVLINTNETYGLRLSTAYVVLDRIRGKINPRSAGAIAAKQKLTQGQTAQTVTELLNDPEKYGLTKEKIADAAWYIAGTPDSANPDAIDQTKLKEALLKKKEAEALSRINKNDTDTASSQFGRVRQKIRNEGISVEELNAAILEERKQQLLAYYANIQNNKELSSASSNSLESLYDLELGLGALRASVNGNKLTADAKQKLIDSINEKIPAIGGVIGSGNGLAFFSDPTGFMASKAGSKIATRVVSSAAGKAAAQALATVVAPGVANAIMLAAEQLLGKVLNKYIAGAIAGIRNNIRRGAQAAIGLIALLVIAFADGAVAAAAAGGVSAIVLAPIVALFLLIINSGGYIVPPGAQLDGSSGIVPPGSGVVENAFVSVTKTANPPGPFGNNFSQSVEYTITVTAKQSPLTNITFKYDCKAANQANNLSCPPAPTVPAAPTQIDPSVPFTFKYTQTYGGQFRDSIVMDSFTVTATAGGQTGNSDTGSAAVIFGNPPTGCFVFADGWTDNDKFTMTTAILQMRSENNYFTRLCSSGAITLVRSSDSVSWGGRTAGRQITIYNPAVGSVRSAFYTITHESGHVYGSANLATFNDFGTIPLPSIGDGYLCSYPQAAKPSSPTPVDKIHENFAESIAVIYREDLGYPEFTCMGGTFAKAYPAYYNFMRSSVLN